MPWQPEAMKDAVGSEMPRGVVKHALIRGCPNGETHLFEVPARERTWGTETSKYPEEKKSTEIPLVAASERGPAYLILNSGMIWKVQRYRVIAPYTK